MSERVERAMALFQEGYNCCQAVMGAFCGEFGIDFETGMRLTAGLGGGMGRLREVCGTCSAMFILAGLRYGSATDKDVQPRAVTYRAVQELAAKFREQNGSIVCHELLGIGGDGNPVPSVRDSGFYAKRPCKEYVRCAAELVESMLMN